MKWQQIVISTTHEFSDIVSLCLIEAGSEGVNVSDYNDIRDILATRGWDYAENALLNADEGPVLVSGYFSEDFDVDVLRQQIDGYKRNSEIETGSLEISVKTIDSVDWENEWKKYYAPIELDKVVIVPKWMKYDKKSGQTSVFLDPGMAFGTGNHETTALCIRLMQEFDLSGKSVLDVGCGSGILGITALRLGARSCHFFDIDPLAVKATRSNLELNGESDKATVYCGNLLDDYGGFADCAFANITADILLLLLNDFKRALKPDAGLVISGLINDRADGVISAYSREFSLKTRLCDGEWQAASFVNDKQAK